MKQGHIDAYTERPCVSPYSILPVLDHPEWALHQWKDTPNPLCSGHPGCSLLADNVVLMKRRGPSMASNGRHNLTQNMKSTSLSSL